MGCQVSWERICNGGKVRRLVSPPYQKSMQLDTFLRNKNKIIAIILLLWKSKASNKLKMY